MSGQRQWRPTHFPFPQLSNVYPSKIRYALRTRRLDDFLSAGGCLKLREPSRARGWTPACRLSGMRMGRHEMGRHLLGLKLERASPCAGAFKLLPKQRFAHHRRERRQRGSAKPPLSAFPRLGRHLLWLKRGCVALASSLLARPLSSLLKSMPEAFNSCGVSLKAAVSVSSSSGLK